MTSTLKKLTLFVVIGHFLTVLVHGIAHAQLEVLASLPAAVFIFSVIWIAPLAALIFLHKGWQKAGALLLLFSMTGALIFGVYNHFVAVTNDHVAHAPQGDWLLPFQITAVLLALFEISGAAVGFLNYQRR
jgi:hypothetical protein